VERAAVYIMVKFGTDGCLFNWLETRRILSGALGADINVIASDGVASSWVRRRRWIAPSLENRAWPLPSHPLRFLRPMSVNLKLEYEECIRPISPVGTRRPNFQALAQFLGDVGKGVRGIPRAERIAYPEIQWAELDLLEDLDGIRAEDGRPPCFTEVETRFMVAATPIVRTQLGEILTKLNALDPPTPTKSSDRRHSQNSSEDALEYFNKYCDGGLESERRWENRFGGA
jgi:hypothetical protein